MIKLVNHLFSNENRKQNQTKTKQKTTIVDLEAMIEPTRPSYKHLHVRV